MAEGRAAPTPSSQRIVIVIAHRLSTIRNADRILFLDQGRIVEEGTTDDVIDRPLHPYTAGLIGSVPSHNKRGQPLNQIPGMTPSLLNLPPGCAFRSRCSHGDEACRATPETTIPQSGRHVRCFHPLLARAAE